MVVQHPGAGAFRCLLKCPPKSSSCPSCQSLGDAHHGHCAMLHAQGAAITRGSSLQRLFFVEHTKDLSRCLLSRLRDAGLENSMTSGVPSMREQYRKGPWEMTRLVQRQLAMVCWVARSCFLASSGHGRVCPGYS